MPVREHYYTSYFNHEQNSAGFQIKAMSPGITPDMQQVIARLIAYRIPPTANEYAIETHPVALRYIYRDAQESILLCSQSSGNDTNGRPGNFFADTLLLEPQGFDLVPPIFYWRSPFWKKRDESSQSQLPLRETLDIEPSLDIERVWEFLAVPQRREQFYKLMCAVVHYERTQRRIVIIDTNENVALWIAAVSCMLPPSYRPLLSFATYHHDPYQAQFMMVGTTTDSAFRASAEQYYTFFILNALVGKVSEVDPSPYASLTSQAMSEQRFEELLLPFFDEYVHRFPLPARIDAQLDAMARYRQLLTRSKAVVLNADEIAAISTVLSVFEQKTIVADDLKELSQLGKIMLSSYKLCKARAEAAQDRGEDISDLEVELKRHKDQYNKRLCKLLDDNKFAMPERLLEQVQIYTKELLTSRTSKQAEQAAQEIGELRQSKGVAVDDLLNQAAYVSWLVAQLQEASPQQYQRMWQYIGPWLHPGEVTQPLLLMSLHLADMLFESQREEERTKLWHVLQEAMKGNERQWLKIAVEGDVNSSGPTLMDFYYSLVKSFPLEQRTTYREMIPLENKNLIGFEIQSDVTNACATSGLQGGLGRVKQWATYAKHSPQISSNNAIAFGLEQLRKHCRSEEWAQLAPVILLSSELAPLTEKTESQLVEATFAHLRFSQMNPEHHKLYERYQDYALLSSQGKTMLAGIQAMEKGVLEPVLAGQINQYMTTLTRNVYSEEISSFLAHFCRGTIHHEQHRLLINALFVTEYYREFWRAYWLLLAQVLSASECTRQAVMMMDFWFRARADTDYFSSPYLPQTFLLNLADNLTEIQKSRGNSIQSFLLAAEKKDWYSQIQDIFTEKKNVLATAGQAVLGQLQRFKPKEQQDEAAEKELQEKNVRDAVWNILKKNNVQKMHRQKLIGVYEASSREIFWTYYWQYLFFNCPASEAIKLFSFWFDDAYNFFENTPIVHEFFIRYLAGVRKAQHAKEFAQRARELHNAATYNGQPRYGWYPLVSESFRNVPSGRFGR